jgi:hypothetical protein
MDSAGIISYYPNGVIYTYYPNSNDTIIDTESPQMRYTSYTGSRDTIISTEAGSFNCTESISEIYYKQTPPTTSSPNPRKSYIYYGKNIGFVKYVYWYALNPNDFNCQLYSYHIEP